MSLYLLSDCDCLFNSVTLAEIFYVGHRLVVVMFSPAFVCLSVCEQRNSKLRFCNDRTEKLIKFWKVNVSVEVGTVLSVA